MHTSSFVKTVFAGIASSLILVGCSTDNNSPMGPGTSTETDAVNKGAMASSPLSGEFLQASLSATKADPSSWGKATWDSRTGKAKLSIRVEGVSTNGVHKVTLNNKGIGVLNVVFGIGVLEVGSEADGIVANVKKGDLIHVFNPNGTLILAGSFQ